MIDMIEINISNGILPQVSALVVYQDKVCYINDKKYSVDDLFLKQFHLLNSRTQNAEFYLEQTIAGIETLPIFVYNIREKFLLIVRLFYWEGGPSHADRRGRRRTGTAGPA